MRDGFTAKAEMHIHICIALLALVFAMFTLIVTLKPEIFQDKILSLQLVIAIPLFMSSILSKAKLITVPGARRMENLAHISFLTGYGLLINTIGILIFLFVSLGASLMFFGANILMALAYSGILTYHQKEMLSTRLMEDSYFFATIVLLGILHILGNY